MSRLLEFLLGSILITVFTIAFLFFSAVHYILREGQGADCTWQSSARAWIDSNADGRIDPDELPLHDVQVHVNDVQKMFLNTGWQAITDHNGDVQLSISVPGCSDALFEISVDIPEGYRATTTPRLEVHPDLWESLRTRRVYYFGFAPEQ